MAIHPFGGVVCEVALSGEQVLAALEHGVSRLGESAGRFPQVSGIRFQVDPERPAGERVLDAVVEDTVNDRLLFLTLRGYGEPDVWARDQTTIEWTPIPFAITDGS